MSPLYKSGAFAQQCFASHPLCLAIKKLDAPAKVLLHCSACRLLHRLTVRSLTSRPAAMAQTEGEPEAPGGVGSLERCVNTHPTALAIREMDMIRDWVGLRCAECRRVFDLDVALFETRQREP